MRSIFGLRRLFPYLLLALLFGASSAFAAGQICGTVRDAGTTSPIEGAGVFVLATDGSYTGFSAVSDAAGAFCVDAIPAGTYDLQIRRANYVTQEVRGVQVQDVTGVDIGLRPFSGALSAPMPNPARERVQLRFALRAPAPVRLEVLDAQGRVLKGWRSDLATAGDHAVTWDFHDSQGRSLPAGLYFVRLSLNGSSSTRAFAHIR